MDLRLTKQLAVTQPNMKRPPNDRSLQKMFQLMIGLIYPSKIRLFTDRIYRPIKHADNAITNE